MAIFADSLAFQNIQHATVIFNHEIRPRLNMIANTTAAQVFEEAPSTGTLSFLQQLAFDTVAFEDIDISRTKPLGHLKPAQVIACAEVVLEAVVEFMMEEETVVVVAVSLTLVDAVVADAIVVFALVVVVVVAVATEITVPLFPPRSVATLATSFTRSSPDPFSGGATITTFVVTLTVGACFTLSEMLLLVTSFAAASSCVGLATAVCTCFTLTTKSTFFSLLRVTTYE